MLHDKDLTLQSAISLCKSAETTRRQMKVLQEKGGALHAGTEPVNVIKRERKRKGMWRPLVRQVIVKNVVLNIYRRGVQLIMLYVTTSN